MDRSLTPSGCGAGGAPGSLRSPRLPAELLLHIIESVPPATNPHALMAASHAATKTLLALTRVSRDTHACATRLLRQHCLYVDSSRRLAELLACMPRLVPTLPPVVSLRHMTSLYLAPFGPSQDDDAATAVQTAQLLCEVGETLRRLVVQIPFGRLRALGSGGGSSNNNNNNGGNTNGIANGHSNSDGLEARRALRHGFEQLTRLQEFACVGEYPALSVADAHTDVWRLWPELRRLALFDVPLDSHWLWWDIATLPELAHVVLARPRHVASTNIKDEYFHKLPRQDPLLGRQIKLVLLDAPLQMDSLDTRRWREIDPSGRMTVEVYQVPVAYHGGEPSQELVTAWVKRGALDGELWTWTGSKLGP